MTVVASLLVKEDTALLLVPLGLWVLWRRNRRWGMWIIAGSIAYALFATQVVIATLLGTSTFYADRIPFGGLGGLIAAPFAHPGRFWTYVRSGYKPFYMWQMGVSFGWVFLIAPEVAAIGVLTLAENVLSTFPYMQQILYHYSLPLVAVLAMGTAFAVGQVRDSAGRHIATSVVVAAALVSCTLWGLAPFSDRSYPHMSPNGPQTIAINQVLTTVPPDAVVSAYYPLRGPSRPSGTHLPVADPLQGDLLGALQRGGPAPPLRQPGPVPGPPAWADRRGPGGVRVDLRPVQIVAQGGGVGVYERDAQGP